MVDVELCDRPATEREQIVGQHQPGSSEAPPPSHAGASVGSAPSLAPACSRCRTRSRSVASSSNPSPNLNPNPGPSPSPSPNPNPNQVWPPRRPAPARALRRALAARAAPRQRRGRPGRAPFFLLRGGREGPARLRHTNPIPNPNPNPNPSPSPNPNLWLRRPCPAQACSSTPRSPSSASVWRPPT
eukprot:scaffold6562_cov60-Phaeocystis_antarctica.AAC.4